MLTQSYRLRRLFPRPGLFQQTMQQGRRVFQCPLFKVIAVSYGPAVPSDNASPLPPVFGFIVSKKVALRANKRNRIKRRLRHLVLQKLIQPWQRHVLTLSTAPQGTHEEAHWLGELSGKAYVMIVHPTCAHASFESMAQAVDALCRRLP